MLQDMKPIIEAVDIVHVVGKEILVDVTNPRRVYGENLYIVSTYGSFHIRLTVDVADLNEIIFFRFIIHNK